MSEYIKVKTFEHDWKVNNLQELATSPSFLIEIEENLLMWNFYIRLDTKFLSFLGTVESSTCNLATLYAKVSCQIINTAGILFIDHESNITSMSHYLTLGFNGDNSLIPASKFDEHVKTLLVLDISTREDFNIKCKVEFFKKAMELPYIEKGSTLLTRMFDDNLFPDFTIKSEEGIKFEVHKAVLAAESTVFCSMFSNDMQEKKSGIVKLDEGHKVLKEMLRFIYTHREIIGLSELAEPLLVAANKYLLDDLKSICAAEILDQIQVDNAVRFLIFANAHNCSDIEDYAAQFIASNFNTVRATEDWDDFNSTGRHAALRNKILDYLLMDIKNLKKAIISTS